MAWAAILYDLRDGQPGLLQKVKWGPWQNTGAAQWTTMPAGRGTVAAPANTTFRQAEPLGPPILIPVSKEALALPNQMQAEEWSIFRPLIPAPELWEALKAARSEKEVRRISRRIEGWMDTERRGIGKWLPGFPAIKFTEVLSQYAPEFLRGKELPAYARTDRPSSDDKRVEFVSKVLAGARFGLAPITAAKRLSHWHFPSNWAEEPLNRYIQWSGEQFAKRKSEAQNK
jgi:hypothetical protein